MEIKNIMQEIHKNNVEKGFWEEIKQKKNVGELLMLCVSELTEALEAHRKGKFAQIFVFEQVMIGNTSTRDPVIFDLAFKNHIKDSFEDEIADTVIRLFDLAEGFGIDLEFHIRQKLDYNKTRPFKHNKAY